MREEIKKIGDNINKFVWVVGSGYLKCGKLTLTEILGKAILLVSGLDDNFSSKNVELSQEESSYLGGLVKERRPELAVLKKVENDKLLSNFSKLVDEQFSN